MFKNVLNFILELFFASKEEYDIKSPKFNPRKIIVITIFFCSLTINVLLMGMVGRVGKSMIEIEEQCGVVLKNQRKASSDVTRLDEKRTKENVKD